MIFCSKAKNYLIGVIDKNKMSIPPDALEELVKMGLLARSDEAGREAMQLDPAQVQLANMKKSLATIRSKICQIEEEYPDMAPTQLMRKHEVYRFQVEELERLEKKEQTLRTSMLNMVHVRSEAEESAMVNGAAYHITFKGQEIVTEITQREGRVTAMPVAAFMAEMETLKRHFDERAKLAKSMLKMLSPDLPKIEEMNLRLVCIGLSGKPGPADRTVSMFKTAYKQALGLCCNVPLEALSLAEAMTLLANSEKDVSNMANIARTILSSSPFDHYVYTDKIKALAIILGAKESWGAVLQRTRVVYENYGVTWLSPAAIIASAAGGSVDGMSSSIKASADVKLEMIIANFRDMNQWMSSWAWDVDHVMAAAILASTLQAPTPLYKKFSTAKQRITDLGIENLDIPAMMIAILPLGIEEALDDMRLAGSAIYTNRMSLGGGENLSLGMKMVVHSSVIMGIAAPVELPNEPFSDVSNLSFMAISGIAQESLDSLSSGLMAFHSDSVHTFARRDYVYHPAHTSYVYG